MKYRNIVMLLLLAFGALLVHGYHPAAEDAEIYLPGIIHLLHPADYPAGQEFFQPQTRLTLFSHLIFWSVRLTHLPLDWVLFLWQMATIFLLLYACWRLASKCFPGDAGRWGAVTMVAALLTLPVAGTSLYILDQYLNPRSISAFTALFAIDAALEKKYLRAAIWLLVTTLIHPLMAVFGASFVLLQFFMSTRLSQKEAALAAIFLPGLLIGTPSAAYMRCLEGRPGLFLIHWHWYEWLGVAAPLALLWWFSQVARRMKRPMLFAFARTTAIFGVFYLAAALVVSVPRELVLLNVYQPMRSLTLVYLFLMLLGGGLLGEFWMNKHAWRWMIVFLPLCAVMCYAQLQLFPADRHVEWPGAASMNPWVQTFEWIRGNTPTGAIFALDPQYMASPGEDHQGFRALAERSRLADANKDWSAAVLFPSLPVADHCLEQVRAEAGWKQFGPADFARLRQEYGVGWVVLERPGIAGLACPYQNSEVLVCRLN